MYFRRESQVKFLGYIVPSDGIKADPAKISAVRNMPIPENKKDLQSFLGMVNYLGKFINNLSELTAPLRTLLIKDSVWSLDEPQAAAINRLKPKFHEQFSMTSFSMTIFICSCRWSHMTIFHMTSVLVQKLACQLFDKCTCHMKNCHM